MRKWIAGMLLVDAIQTEQERGFSVESVALRPAAFGELDSTFEMTMFYGGRGSRERKRGG